MTPNRRLVTLACAGLFLGAASPARSQVSINEVDLLNNKVEIVNHSGAAVDMSTWWICNRVNGSPFYQALASGATIDAALSSPGATYAIFGAGQTLVVDVSANTLPDTNGELGLYNTNSFGTPSAVEDYVAWGGDGIRDLPASIAGWWPDGEFIDVSSMTTGDTLQANPDTLGVGPDEWLIGPGTLGGTNIAPPPVQGACCVNGACGIAFESDCDDAGGSYSGDGTTCGGITCPEVCIAETTGDVPAMVNVQDLLNYLAVWFDASTGGPCPGVCIAETTGDVPAMVNVQDLLNYLAVWFDASTGGPCP